MKTASRHNPNPRYLRQLIRDRGHTQVSAAAEIGVCARSMRNYLSLNPRVQRDAPHPVQIALENLSRKRRGKGAPRGRPAEDA